MNDARTITRGGGDHGDRYRCGQTERLKGTLSDLLGMRVVEATPDRVVAELVIRTRSEPWGARCTAAR